MRITFCQQGNILCLCHAHSRGQLGAMLSLLVFSFLSYFFFIDKPSMKKNCLYIYVQNVITQLP